MKFLLSIGGVCLSAVVAAAQRVQPARLDLSNLPPAANFCTGWEPTTFTRERLQMDCGFDENFPCAVFTRKKESTDDPQAACNSKVGIQTTDAILGTVEYIHGEIAGYLNAFEDIGSSLALEYGGYSLVCPYPCENDNDPHIVRCVGAPELCEEGYSPKPRRVESPSNIIVNHLVSKASLALDYKFDDTDSEIPGVNPDIVDEKNGHPAVHFPDMWEIKQGEEPVCVTTDKWTYEPAEAYEPLGCGWDGKVPCPLVDLSGSVGQCFDESAQGPQCYDVTFWTEGLDDSGGVYCATQTSCASRTHTRRFRIVDDQNSMHIPIGVWRDFCPYECATAADGDKSGVCAAAASDCVAVPADTTPANPPTAPWDYMIPGSQEAHIHYVSAASVECDAEPPTPAPSPSTGTAPTTVEGTSAAHRGVVGSLTAFLVACGVVYNF